MVNAQNLNRPNQGKFFIGCDDHIKSCQKPAEGMQLAIDIGVRVSDKIVCKPRSSCVENTGFFYLWTKGKEEFTGNIALFLNEYYPGMTRQAVSYKIREGKPFRGWNYKKVRGVIK